MVGEDYKPNGKKRGKLIRGNVIPEKLTLEWLKAHATIHLTGGGLRWVVAAWRNIIFLKISKQWKPEEMDGYVNRLSRLPAILSKVWSRIFLVLDLSRMKFKKEDAFRYLRANWLEFLDREAMQICIIEENKMRRLLLRSLCTAIGKLNKIKLFPGCDEALSWVREEIVSGKRVIAV